MTDTPMTSIPESAIKLHCRGCGKKFDYSRDTDPRLPSNVVRIESASCDDCDNGDFGLEFWFDAAGNEVPQS